MKKKVMAIALAIMMCISFAIFTGCSDKEAAGASDSGTTATSSEQQSGNGEKTLEGKKLGILLSVSGSGATKYANININQVIEDMGGTTQWEDFDFTPEGLISGAEKLITAGCDGIIVVPSGDSALPKVTQMCEEAGVYWGIFLRSINDEEIRKMVTESEYYVGNTYEDEIMHGYEFGKRVGESGAKKVAIISTAKGDTTGDNREIGFNKACDEYGIEIVAEARAIAQADEATKAVESFIASYPDLDAVCVVASQVPTLEAACQGIRDTDSIGKIMLHYGDFATGMPEAIEEGIASSFAGGHIPYDATVCAAMVYNVLQGTPVSDDKMSIRIAEMPVSTTEDAEAYYKYVEGDIPLFKAEEVDTMLNKAKNPDLTEEDFIALGENFGMEDLVKRHGE